MRSRASASCATASDGEGDEMTYVVTARWLAKEGEEEKVREAITKMI